MSERIRILIVSANPLPTSRILVDLEAKEIREKLEEDPSHPKHILTVRGVGYRLVWD